MKHETKCAWKINEQLQSLSSGLTTPNSSEPDDEYEEGGFDGVDCAYGPGRRTPLLGRKSINDDEF